MNEIDKEKRPRGEPIHKVELRNGKTRYRVVADIGIQASGPRRQQTRTFDTKKEAQQWLAKTRLGQDLTPVGMKPAGAKLRVRTYLDSWLDGREGIRENTREGYRCALRPVYEAFGDVPLQGLSVQMLLDLKQQMKMSGGRTGNGYSPRSIQYTLTTLAAALEAAKDAKLIQDNVANYKLVERPKPSIHKGQAWSEDEVRIFSQSVSGHRLETTWLISLCGLRRSEVLGLRWSDVNLENGTLTVQRSRTPRKRKDVTTESTVIADPKRPRSFRTIPLPAGVLAALRSFRRLRQEESLRMGIPLSPDEFIASNAVGEPIHPDTYSRWFKRAIRQAGLPEGSLHDARRTTATLLSTLYGVSADAAASYLGHDPVTYHRVYVQGDRGHESVASALERMATGTEN